MKVVKQLERWGGVVTDGHFVYTSDKHGPAYINFDVGFTHPKFLWQVCRALIKPYKGKFDVIVAPATGGVALAAITWVYAWMFWAKKVKFVWADKGDDKQFVFERAGFAKAVKGKRVLIVDDIMTNANPQGSVYKLCRLVEASGSNVVGVSIVVNRCGGTAEDLEVPRLMQLDTVDSSLFYAVTAEDCALDVKGLCQRAVPIVDDVGHGAEYKSGHPDYKGGYVSLLS